MKPANQSKKPPKIAEYLMSRMFPDENHYTTVSDLEEEFLCLLSEKGKTFAVLWYWLQLIPAFVQCSIHKTKWSSILFKNYLKIALRNIKRNKTNTFLNLFGLSVGMAVFLLFLLYVKFEMSYDRYHENPDLIYRVVQKQVDRKHYIQIHGTNIIAVTHAPLAKALTDEFPEVNSAVRVQFRSNTLISSNNAKFIEDKICFVDPSLFEIFSFELIKGDPVSTLTDPNSIIISERMAKKYFPDDNPIGKILTYNTSNELRITGVMENIPENSHFRMDFIIPFRKYDEMYYSAGTSWDNNWHCYTYIKFRQGADIKGFEKKLVPLAEKVSGIVGTRNDFMIQPVTSIHLHSHLFIEIEENSDIKYVYILLTIAFLVLVIACLNYINLTTACSSKRSREVGVRKVVGAEKKQLVYQFFGESLMVTIIALVLSVILFYLVLPTFNTLVERNLSLDIINIPQIILLISALFFLVGILAGMYPAVFISSYKPITAL
ncbi:ABC transporter permease, partial [candidate division KSB1 bacterium]